MIMAEIFKADSPFELASDIVRFFTEHKELSLEKISFHTLDLGNKYRYEAEVSTKTNTRAERIYFDCIFIEQQELAPAYMATLAKEKALTICASYLCPRNVAMAKDSLLLFFYTREKESE